VVHQFPTGGPLGGHWEGTKRPPVREVVDDGGRTANALMRGTAIGFPVTSLFPCLKPHSMSRSVSLAAANLIHEMRH